MQIDKQVLELYYSCLRSQTDFNNYEPMRHFKEEHKKEYNYIYNCYQKRCKIQKCCDALKEYGQDVFFGALTFDNEHDTSTIENKRKQAFRCLYSCFAFWVAVEEYGEENGRYHLHFFGTYKQGVRHEDLRNTWHSGFCWIKPIKRQDIRYCTDYTSKQCPRVRMSDSMRQLVNSYKKARSWEFNEFLSLADLNDFDAILTIQENV